MKKVLKPERPEEAIYYSDFSGKLFRDFVPVTVKIECGYGSEYDGAEIKLHLSDNGANKLLAFLKENLCAETKELFVKQAQQNNENKNFYLKLTDCTD